MDQALVDVFEQARKVVAEEDRKIAEEEERRREYEREKVRQQLGARIEEAFDTVDPDEVDSDDEPPFLAVHAHDVVPVG